MAQPLAQAGIPVTSMELSRHRPNPAVLLSFVRYLRAKRPTILQTWLYHADLLGTAAAFFAKPEHLLWNVRCSDVNQPGIAQINAIYSAVSGDTIETSGRDHHQFSRWAAVSRTDWLSSKTMDPHTEWRRSRTLFSAAKRARNVARSVGTSRERCSDWFSRALSPHEGCGNLPPCRLAFPARSCECKICSLRRWDYDPTMRHWQNWSGLLISTVVLFCLADDRTSN